MQLIFRKHLSYFLNKWRKNYKKMKNGIYSITNIVNGKRLIGLAKDITRRLCTHRCLLNHNKHHNPHLQLAWNKYGERNFKFEILLLCPIESLNNEEIRLIAKFNTMNSTYGYNMQPGGKRPQHSLETIRKMSESKKGKKNANYGRIFPEETRQRMRNAFNSGRRKAGDKLTEETKRKISETLKRLFLERKLKPTIS